MFKKLIDGYKGLSRNAKIALGVVWLLIFLPPIANIFSNKAMKNVDEVKIAIQNGLYAYDLDEKKIGGYVWKKQIKFNDDASSCATHSERVDNGFTNSTEYKPITYKIEKFSDGTPFVHAYCGVQDFYVYSKSTIFLPAAFSTGSGDLAYRKN